MRGRASFFGLVSQLAYNKTLASQALTISWTTALRNVLNRGQVSFFGDGGGGVFRLQHTQAYTAALGRNSSLHDRRAIGHDEVKRRHVGDRRGDGRPLEERRQRPLVERRLGHAAVVRDDASVT